MRRHLRSAFGVMSRGARPLRIQRHLNGHAAGRGRLTRLLCEINDMARSARTSGADAIEARLLTTYRYRYDTIIAADTTAHSAPPGNHGRPPAVNLPVRLSGFATDVLRFAHDLRVPLGQQPRRTRHPHGQTPAEDQRRTWLPGTT
jgi:hypothetical protein